MSNLFIIILFLLVLIIGYFKKVDCFNEFIYGSKEGVKTTINMFSSLLTFQVALSFLFSSGLIDYISNLFDFDYGLLLVQIIVRPLSSSSSLSLMLEIYKNFGVDSFISLLSTGLHYVSDASLYIIPFYTSLYNIKKTDKLILLGFILNIISYIIVIFITFFFYNIIF